MSDMSSLTNIANRSSRNESQTATLIERQSLLMCVSSFSPVQPNSTEELRTWLLEAFPANPLALQESKQAQTMPEICGQQQATLFGLSDLPAFSWKTYQDYCNSTTAKVFSLTLPKWGMWDDTALYPLPTAVLDTDGNDCGLLANWPSPTCSDVYTGNLKSTQQKPGSMHSVTLPQAVAMWPTPDANMGARGTNPEWKPIRDSGQTAQYPINQAVRDESGTGALNPDWCEWLMGWPVGWSDIKPLAELNWRDWKTDPADIGEVLRVTDVKENRANRLKAIGNGQVPQCVVKAWELLS